MGCLATCESCCSPVNLWAVSLEPVLSLTAPKPNAYDRLRARSSTITTYRIATAEAIVPTSIANRLGPSGSKRGTKATSEIMMPITPPTRVAIRLERRPYLYRTAEGNSTRYTARAPIVSRIRFQPPLLSAFTPFRGSACHYFLKARSLFPRAKRRGVSLEYPQCRRLRQRQTPHRKRPAGPSPRQRPRGSARRSPAASADDGEGHPPPRCRAGKQRRGRPPSL